MAKKEQLERLIKQLEKFIAEMEKLAREVERIQGVQGRERPRRRSGKKKKRPK